MKSERSTIETTGPSVETRKVRRRRRRRDFAGVLSKILGGLVATAALAGAGVGIHQVFYENPDFSVGLIHTETDGTLTRERILALAEVPVDQNIFQIDLEQLRKRLEEAPFIRKAEVERRLPDVLVIRVEERMPIAWVSAPALGILPDGSGHAVLIDRDGVALRGEQLLSAFGDLPVIQADGIDRFPIGKPVEDESLRVASALIEWWVEQPQLGAGRIKNIVRVNEFSVRAVFEGGLEATFGLQDLGRQLSDLDLILRHAFVSKRRLETVNLMMKKNIPVTYADAAAEPPLNLRPVSGKNLE